MVVPPDHLLNALKTVTVSHRAAQHYADLLKGQRDRLLAQLGGQVPLRELAGPAGMHHTQVGRIAKKGITDRRFMLLTIEIPDWNVATPEDVAGFLKSHYPEGPPVRREELQSLLTDHQARAVHMEGNNAAWPWWVAQCYGVLERAISGSALTELDVLGAARAMMLSATWRVVVIGEDKEAVLRERGVALMARLLVDV